MVDADENSATDSEEIPDLYPLNCMSFRSNMCTSQNDALHVSVDQIRNVYDQNDKCQASMYILYFLT